MSRLLRKQSIGIAFVMLFGMGWALSAAATPTTDFVISEVLFDAVGADDNLQWVELYNGTGASIDLSSYSLGWGRFDYTEGILQLSGILPAGASWVVGGPTSNANNGSPTFQQPVDLAPDLRTGNSFFLNDGVALFNVPALSITPTLAPIHAVIYGSGFFTIVDDETGSNGTPLFDTSGFVPGSSIEFFGDEDWRAQPTPTPGATPATIPEPETAALLGIGLSMLTVLRAAERRGLIVV